MLKAVIIVVVVLLFVGGGFYFYRNSQTKRDPLQSTQATPSSPASYSSALDTLNNPCVVLTNGSDDVPPLYKEGVTWTTGKLTKDEVLVYDENDNLNKGLYTGCQIKTSGLDYETATKIQEYYYEKNSYNGWAGVFSTDSPNGSLVTYRKQNKYLSIDLRVNQEVSSSEIVRYNIKIFYSE